MTALSLVAYYQIENLQLRFVRVVLCRTQVLLGKYSCIAINIYKMSMSCTNRDQSEQELVLFYM